MRLKYFVMIIEIGPELKLNHYDEMNLMVLCAIVHATSIPCYAHHTYIDK